ncbi:metallophosphoesterase [soil metagenome]
MRRIAHLSDLHFGRTRPELLEPMIAAVNGASVDLIALSGDLTQRARDHQFREARAFIDRLEAPCLVVPGNHDVPLDNPLLRFLAPWRRYRRWIGADLEPVHADEAMVVVGINTADPMAWQRGRVRSGSLRRACAEFAQADGRMLVVVAHHPFEHLPEETKEPMPGAAEALERLAGCGAHIVLSGHLHSWRAAPFSLPRGRRGILQVQAGTGLSTRLRREENDFNLLRIESGEVVIERFVPDPATHHFTRTANLRFRRGPSGWEDGVAQ